MKPLRYVLLILLCLMAIEQAANCQSSFDKAHALLEQLAQDQHELSLETPARSPSVMYDRVAAEVKEVPPQAEQLINQGILGFLNKDRTPTLLKQEIDSTLQVNNTTTEDASFVLPTGNPPRFYLIGYTISFCAICARNWIGIVGPRPAGWEILAELQNQFQNQGIKIFPLNADVNNLTFLVRITNWGDAHNRVSVQIYRFNGHDLKSIWSVSDLAQGQVQVSGSEVTLKYLTTLVPPFEERTDVYSLRSGIITLDRSATHPAD
ncbi:MAG: hypothetical protein WAN69_18535 [Candidatus Korobacteraceae bacterium]